MKHSLDKLMAGYEKFRTKYAKADPKLMKQLASDGQAPETMVISCSDSRVDPAVLLQCNPGDLFVVRNIANLVPPYEYDEQFYGTSAALEFGICYLNVKHLIIIAHSCCAGVSAKLKHTELTQDDFISKWTSLINLKESSATSQEEIDNTTKKILLNSHSNCLSYPWIKSKIEQGTLAIHLWFFDIAQATLYRHDFASKKFVPLLGD